MQGCLKRIVVMVLLLGVVFNYRAYAAGLLPEYTGFLLSILYLLSFVIAPLPHKKDSVVLMLSMFAGMAILYVMHGHQMISFFRQFSIRITVVIGYYYVWSSNRRMAERDATAFRLKTRFTTEQTSL